jgi:hypothetical protein
VGSQANAPDSAPVAQASTPAPPAVHKAPPGCLYVLKRVSKTTSSGVVGVAPGTRLTIISKGAVVSVMSDGIQQFDVDNDIMTDDQDIAALARQSDSNSQAALAGWMQQRQALIEQSNRDAAKKLEPTQSERPASLAQASSGAARSAAAPPNPTGANPSSFNGFGGTSLDKGAYNQRYSRPWWWYQDRWGYRYYVDGYGHWIYY